MSISLTTTTANLSPIHYELADEEATVALAGKLAQQCHQGLVIYLEGDLGAGKTTFSRGFIQALGHIGKVKSPTYTLVEPYEIAGWRVFHFDLYRLSDPEELEFMGNRDYFDADCICLIEWPDKGAGLLAPADLDISIEYTQTGRTLSMQVKSAKGSDLLKQLN
jgi:tRNA threonylcarbamoyladenosine biosynthesis protein TsaE